MPNYKIISDGIMVDQAMGATASAALEAWLVDTGRNFFYYNYLTAGEFDVMIYPDEAAANADVAGEMAGERFRVSVIA